MDLSLFQILAVLAVSFIGQTVNSSLGMLYGTITSAILVALEFPPLVVVPAILASEAFADFIASRNHLALGNFDLRFWRKKESDLEEVSSKKPLFSLSPDLKVSLIVIFFGGAASILAVLVAISIPTDILKTYIGSVTLVLGMLLVVEMRYSFSWLKIVFFSLVSAFTNTLGGGGFGAFLTSGQIISGRDERSSIGVTTFSESILSFIGFVGYLALEGIHDWEIIFFLCFGAFWGAKLGPKLTDRLQSRFLRKALGLFIISLGFLILTRLWLGWPF